MKNFIRIIFILVLITSSFSLNAQTNSNYRKYKFGIVAGANFIHYENFKGGEYSQFNEQTKWHIGLSFQYKWGRVLTYSIQPELRYSVFSTIVDPIIGPTNGEIITNSLELPINLQFGVQLSKIFRPFVQTTLYGSYITKQTGSFFDDGFNDFGPINRYSLGGGLGLGFEIWKFQLQCNYRWGFTKNNKENYYYNYLVPVGYSMSVGLLF